MSEENAVGELLRAYVENPEAGWSCGAFGAIAEFMRDPQEPVTLAFDGGLGATTARGALRIDKPAMLRPIAYEMPSRDPKAWQHGVALCLPVDACAMGRRTVLTELGPDTAAARPQDRDAVLFDLGLGLLHVDACVRTADPETLAVLRQGVGLPLFDHASPVGMHLPRLSPHRVFVCRFGRVEVFQPIPAPGGTSPEGPHTHVLPKLLKAGLTHAANLPIPEGWVPPMMLFPPSPIRDMLGRDKPFDRSHHEAFQKVWARFGTPELVALKARMMGAAMPDEDDAEVDDSRAAGATARVARRQRAYRGMTAAE